MTTMTTMTTTEPDTNSGELVADRLIRDVTTVLETLSTHLGLRLGLFAGLHDLGPSTSTSLASHAGVDTRYTREWCEQQTVAGMVTCLDPTQAPTDRVFALSEGVSDALLVDDSGAWVAPLVELLPGITDVLDTLATAWQTGSGVPFHAYGAPIRHGLGDLNGVAFTSALPEWLASVPGLMARLDQPGAQVLDLGCGTGRSSLAIARMAPRARVLGVDLDPASIDEAVAAARAAGLDDRVHFVVADAANLEVEPGSHTLVTVFEAIHDMGDPVGALRTARRALESGGVCYVADERVADEFGPEASVVERLQYGFSVLHCLPATRAEDPVVAHGTVLRAPTLGGWARDAGFAPLERLEVDDPFWQHYLLPA
ncbi:MAG TPA: methyltransferase domain-containing protein [Nitriliruptoraceae bacterium]|nr:methyltransferase domain-containing protein [Nitriliruptoraceae bacterium]